MRRTKLVIANASHNTRSLDYVRINLINFEDTKSHSSNVIRS